MNEIKSEDNIKNEDSMSTGPLWETLHPLERCLGETVQDGYPRGIARKMICPICGDPCVHVRTDDSYPGGHDYTLGLACFCEQGHAWEILFAFHKGETTVWLQASEKPASFAEFLRETAPRRRENPAMQQNATGSGADQLDGGRGGPL